MPDMTVIENDYMGEMLSAQAMQAYGRNLENVMLEEQILERFGNISALGRTMVGQAWEAGCLLVILHERYTASGTWTSWLEDWEVSPDRADRYMQLAGMSKEEAVRHATIGSALKALPAPPAPPPPPPPADDEEDPEPPSKKLTAAEKWEIERSQLRQQAQEAEAEAEELRQQGAEKQQMIDHLQNSANVDEGFEAGRSVLEERQQEIRQLRAALSRRDDEIADLKRQNASLRATIKKLRGEAEQESEPSFDMEEGW